MKLAALLLALVACAAPDRAQTSADGRVVTLEQGRSRVHVEIEGDPAPEQRAAIVAWVEDAVRAVAEYYGRFPVDAVRLAVRLQPGEDIGGGVASTEAGMPLIRIRVGAGAGARSFADDWELTHELVHTAFPELAPEHHWLEEGLATYVEPLARARVGLESEADVWRQLVEGLPKGQPRRGDRGLDRTPTWGRTYWGGALFCFVADVRIRERTGNRLGLRDTLRALVEDGWTMRRWARIEDVLARMDATVGAPVLTELYAQHARDAVRVDLGEMWKRLGVVYHRGRVTFDDSAPRADIRRAMTR